MLLLYLAPADSAHSNRWLNFFTDDFKVIWVTFHKPNSNLASADIEVYYLGGGMRASLAQYFKLVKRLKESSVSVVQVHSVARYLIVPWLLRIIRGDVKVASAWGSDVFFPRYRFLQQMFQKKILNSFDWITADSSQMIDRLGLLGVKEKKLLRINFGVETSFFKPFDGDELSPEVLQKYSLDPSRPYIISLRNLFTVYDLGTFVRAAGILSSQGVKIDFIMGGWGDQREKLEDLALTLGISSQIKFLGRYDHADLPHLLNAASAYVSTSTSDAGIAASTAEAMSCGALCVVSDNSENNLWIESGVNGLLFETGSPQDLADKLVQMLSLEKSRRDQMKGRARQKIIESNDLSVEMSKVAVVYKLKSAKLEG
jgi:L-malate glycosyltransferase